jgi:hypothetical protein
MMVNAKRFEQVGSQPTPSGFEPRHHRQHDAGVAGRTPRLSSVGTTGSSPVGIAILAKVEAFGYNALVAKSADATGSEPVAARRAGANPAEGTISIDVFMLQSLEERQAHLRLSEPCIERGGNSYIFRGVLAQFHHTTFPSKKYSVACCHACNNDRCSNPRHLYWGTYSENLQDAIAAGRWNPAAAMKGKIRFKHGTIYAWMTKRCVCSECTTAKWLWHDQRNATRRRVRSKPNSPIRGRSRSR